MDAGLGDADVDAVTLRATGVAGRVAGCSCGALGVTQT